MASPDGTAIAAAMVLGNSALQNTTLIHSIAAFANTTNNLPAGMDIFYILAPFALLAVPQRSASDEFASWTIAPTRASPFICAADIISTLLWILHGWHLGLPWKKCAQLAVTKSAVSGDSHRRKFHKGQNITLAIVFLFTLMKAAKAFTTEGIFWEKTWVVLFLAAYVIHVCIDILASYAPAPTLDQLRNENEDETIRNIFKIVDGVNCVAYAFQIKAWIDIFGNLVKVTLNTYGEQKVNTGILAMVCLAVILSLISPKKGPYKVLHGLWLLRNWDTNHKNTIVVCVFVIFLMLGLPIRPNSSTILIMTQHSSLLWPLISTPLGTLSVVVFMVYVVSIGHTLMRKMCRVEVPQEFETIPVEDRDPLDPLATRLNVVVGSMRKWREILSISFALCNFLFGFLHYTFVYPSITAQLMG